MREVRAGDVPREEFLANRTSDILDTDLTKQALGRLTKKAPLTVVRGKSQRTAGWHMIVILRKLRDVHRE